eukprot:scaffold611_cov367-Pavlova_lutheri.AAC.1
MGSRLATIIRRDDSTCVHAREPIPAKFCMAMVKYPAKMWASCDRKHSSCLDQQMEALLMYILCFKLQWASMITIPGAKGRRV